jgi:uncharacterized protein (UPF0332 family)
MTFEWIDYIKLSQILLKTNQESYLRSSISRAYYGAFCLARKKIGYSHKSSNVHSEVIASFKKNNNIYYKKIGKNLDELRRARNNSDYNENIIINKEFAKRMVTLSLSILGSLKNI